MEKISEKRKLELLEKYPVLKTLEHWLDWLQWEHIDFRDGHGDPIRVHYVDPEVFALLTDRQKEIVIFFPTIACGLIPYGWLDPLTWDQWEYFDKLMDVRKAEERRQNERKA